MRLISSREANVLDGVEVWAGYYRANPQRFAKDYLNVNLRLFQKILLFMMNISNFFVTSPREVKASHGFWLCFAACDVSCTLAPRFVLPRGRGDRVSMCWKKSKWN